MNPGPRQTVVDNATETTRECDFESQCTTSEKSVDSRLDMLSACQRKHLQNETSAEQTSRLARLIENQRQRLENESEEQRSARLGRLTDNLAQRLANETKEQRSARLSRLRDNRAQRLANETVDQRSARLDRRAQRLGNETMEERSERLSQLSRKRRKRKQSETNEERIARVTKIAARKQARISTLSEEENAVRLQRQREQARLRMQALRRKRLEIAALHSPVVSDTSGNPEGVPAMHVQVPQLCIEIPVNQGSKISSNLVKFRKAILEAPSNKCFSCKKLHYSSRLDGMIAWDEVSRMLEGVVNLSVDDSIRQLWFCNKCKKSLQQKKIPAASQFNDMKVAKVPLALRELNTLEERLISKATVFMKMVILPRGGQRAVRCQVINFPSDVDGIVSQLPRPPSGEDIVYVQ